MGKRVSIYCAMMVTAFLFMSVSANALIARKGACKVTDKKGKEVSTLTIYIAKKNTLIKSKVITPYPVTSIINKNIKKMFMIMPAQKMCMTRSYKPDKSNEIQSNQKVMTSSDGKKTTCSWTKKVVGADFFKFKCPEDYKNI